MPDNNAVEFKPKLNPPAGKLLARLQTVIRFSVRCLAVLMTFVIAWGVLDVVLMLWERLSTPPYFLLNISDILATFGAFMAVLIAIEIFVNIVMYLDEDIIQKETIHIKLVVSTALMAAARKVIVMDFTETASMYIFGLAAVILALGVTFWLLQKTICK